MRYAELHCHTNFSFLDGASHPEELAEEAARLGLAAPGGHRPRRLLRRGALRRSPPASTALPTVFGAELTLGITRPAERRARSAGRAPARARRGTGRVRPARAGDQRGAAGGGEGRAPHHDPGARRPSRAPRAPPPARERARTTRGSCSPAVARARCRRRWCATARPRRDARSTSSSPRSGATACSSSCGTTATRSTGTATTRSRGLRAGRGRRRRRHQQRALRHARAAPARHRARGGARRAVRSTRSTAGSPRRRSRTCAAPAEQARRFARWPGAVERTVDDRAARARSTSGSRRPSCPTTTCPPVTPR